MIARVLAFARRTPVRVAIALAGVAGVAWILHGLGWANVAAALAGGAPYLPLVLLLDGLVVTCSMLALRALYGDAGASVPKPQLVRAGVIGFAVNGLLPAGRAIAEITRATMLTPWVGRGVAIGAAARMQGVVLIGHGGISVVATVAAFATFGATWLTFAISLSAAIPLIAGIGTLLLTRRTRIGVWVARRFGGGAVGAEVDAALAGQPTIPLRAVAWELAGRCVEVAQKSVLILAVGGGLAFARVLSLEGVHLLGAAVGDLVPSQIGVQEGNLVAASHALGLTSASAVSIALLAHLSQLTWVLVGSIVAMIWRGDRAAAPALLEPASRSPS
jgi:hypothetical protein